MPVLGLIACGEPIEPYHCPNATLLVSSTLIKAGDKFLFAGQRRYDDRMMYFEGDYVVVKEQK